jgi:DNA-directed RNA polymerase alpha subunit
VRRLLGDERWRGRVELRKAKDAFIFTVEAAGALAPDALVREALRILSAKAAALEARL